MFINLLLIINLYNLDQSAGKRAADNTDHNAMFDVRTARRMK